MAIAESNREALGFLVEVSYGVIPSIARQLVNFTDTTIGQTNETTDSNVIRSDTNRAGTIRTGVNAGGDFGFELKFASEFDTLFEATLRGTFTADISISETTISAVNATNSYDDSGSGFVSAGVQVGQWIRTAGFTGDTTNNGVTRVTSVAAGSIVVTGITLVDDAAGETVTMKGGFLKNATTKKSFTFEREFEDITQFISVTGMRVSEMSINFATSSIATGTWSFIGKLGADATSSIATGADTAAATTASMNTIDDVKNVYIDNAIFTGDLTNIDFTVTTNSESLKKIGSLTGVDVRQGSIGVSGTIGEYFEDAVLLGKSFNFTSFRLAIHVEDAAGNAYIFDFGEVFITGGGPDNPGIDQTITNPFTFSAVLDSTDLSTMAITRIPA